MAVPAWFQYKVYRANKLADLNEQFNNKYDALTLAQAFEAAGYPNTEEGMYKHFEDYGNDENISPNKYFDPDYYYQAKAADYFGVKNINRVSDAQVQYIKEAFAKYGFSAWDHYTKFGFAEGIDPNANFSTSAYLNAKLESLQKTDPSATLDDVINAFKANGLNPIIHYYGWGQFEGLPDSAISSGSHATTVTQIVGEGNYTGTLGDPVVDEVTGDLKVNDSYDDYFNAESGKLNDYVSVDGYGGNDTLYARVTGEYDSGIEPTVDNVETILFRAQHVTDVDQSTAAKVSAVIDADRMLLDDGKRMTFGSDNSRDDLTIEDIRHNSSETTIRFADADPAVGFYVYFDPQHLTPVGAADTGVLRVKLMDVKNAQLNQDPLTESPFDQFVFNYYGSNGVTEVVLDMSTVADESMYKGADATYESLTKALNLALDAYVKEHSEFKGIFTIVKSGKYSADAEIDGREYHSDMGEYIYINCDSGRIPEDEASWAVSTGRVPAKGRIVWDVDSNTVVECPLIEVEVEVDNTGRVQWDDASLECLPDDIIYGSEAGDFQIGSMAMRGGIERMDVKVDRGSWIDALYSTNNSLRMVTVDERDINDDGFAGDTVDKVGELYIGAWEGHLDELDDMGGVGDGSTNMTWTDPAKLLQAHVFDGTADSQSGLVDVAVFDADYDDYGTYAGDINIAALITEESFDKYLKSVDGVRGIDNLYAPNTHYNGAFTYNTGSGNDVVNMTVNGEIAADRDFTLNIDTNIGDDLVAFRYDAMSEEESVDQKYLKNVNIKTEDGNDTVWFYGADVSYHTYTYTYYDEDTDSYKESTYTYPALEHLRGSVNINAGSGDDVIYANQVEYFTGGAQTPQTEGKGVTLGPDLYNAVFVFNASEKEISNVIDNYGATLNNNFQSGLKQVYFTSTDDVKEGYDALYVQIDFKGFRSAVKVENYTYDKDNLTFAVDTDDINQAIIKGINENSVLGEVLAAKDGAGHSLIVESLINGEMTEDDLTLTFQLRGSKVDDYGLTVLGSDKVASDHYNTHFAHVDVDALAAEGDAAAEVENDDRIGINVDDVRDVDAKYEYRGADNLVFSQAIINAGAGNDVIVLGKNPKDPETYDNMNGEDQIPDNEGTNTYGTDVIVLSQYFGRDAVFDFDTQGNDTKHHDVINVKDLVGHSLSEQLNANPDAMIANGAYVVKSCAKIGDGKWGYNHIFTESEVDKLQSDKDTVFAKFVNNDVDTGSHALVVLQDDDTYTFVQCTKVASTTTADLTVMGSLTLAEGTEINAVDLVGVSDLVNDADLDIHPVA